MPTLNLNYNIQECVDRRGGPPKNALVSYKYNRAIETAASFGIAVDGSDISGFTGMDVSGAFTVTPPVTTDPASLAIASITGSSCPTTGSTTMSLEINDQFMKPITISVERFGDKTNNLNTFAGYLLTASFHTSAWQRYLVTGSITHIRGNLSNADINWIVSGSKQSNAQFDIKKDETVLMVSSSVTESKSGSFKNTYALNLTASLNGKDYIWYSSSSFKQVTQSLIIPEIGVNLVSYTTASYLTSSWVAQEATSSYNVTASVLLVPYDPYYIEEYIMIGGGGGAAAANDVGESTGGGGAGGVVSGSAFLIQPDSRYIVTIGGGGSGITGAGGGLSSFVSESITYIIANGGGGGAQGGTVGGDGGSGGGASGGPAQQQSNSGGSATSGSGSGTWIAYGNKGGDGYQSLYAPAPTYPFNIGGGGGGAGSAGTDVPKVNICSGDIPGGNGIDNLMIQYTLGISASLAKGGDGGAPPAGCNGRTFGIPGTNAVQYTGGGGGGASGYSTGTYNGGNGASGSFVLKYLGTQKGRGGTVTYDGTYTYHTFTASGIFYSTANLLPDYV